MTLGSTRIVPAGPVTRFSDGSTRWESPTRKPFCKTGALCGDYSTAPASAGRRGTDADVAQPAAAVTEFLAVSSSTGTSAIALADAGYRPRKRRPAGGTHGISKISLGPPPPIVSASALYFGSFQAAAPRRRIR